MKVLAVDTTTSMLTAAVCDQGRCLGEYAVYNQKAHSQRLMPLIERLLQETGLSLEQIDLFAAANGPGSFTGIRIGLACIKGLAQVMKKPVAAVNTLEGLAYNAAGENREIFVLLDGGRRRVYAAGYGWDGSRMVCRTQPFAAMVEEIAELIRGRQDVVLAGDGGLLYAEELGLPCLGERLCFPMASSVAAAALTASPIPAQELTAVYISKPQAQRELEQRLQKGK